MTLRGDTKEAVRFLSVFRPNGPWVLTAIAPDRKLIETQTFADLDEAERWIEPRNGRLNLYFCVNPVIKPVTSKPAKTDILGLEYLHVDCDPRAGEDIETERARILSALQNYDPPPTIIVDSGGGFQGFWRLDRIHRTDGDVAKAEDLERYSRQIEINLGADKCHDICRVMRLVGTLNLPDEKKKKRGRTVALAKIAGGQHD